MVEKKKFTWLDISYLSLTVMAAVTVTVVYIVYTQTQAILKERLRERLISIAATAVLQIDPKEIEKMQKSKNIEDPELKHVISIIRKVRDNNPNLKYIYIWSKTDDKNSVAFTADAEMLEPIDRDGNGVIDGVEVPPAPGEPYDITDLQKVKEAFDHPTAQEDFIFDKWGTFLSGFAPIRNKDGVAIAVLGIDVEVGDYYKLVRATFVPFLSLSIFLLFALIVQTVVLMKIWKSRVKVVQELDRQKDELLSIVSHQLATPVSSVKWYAEMLLDGDLGALNKDQSEHVNIMQNVTSNLSDLVSMILDVSRIQLGRVKIEKQELKLGEFFKEILEIVTPKAQERGVNLNVSVPKTFPVAQLDKRYTHMTVENLLSNAIKYTPKGGKVDFKVEVKNGRMYCEVRDTGCGIPKADQSKIFGKLFRASNVRNTVDGNGFGLYVAKGAIEAQGGKIWFESKENIGTAFFIDLPLNEK